MKNLKCPICESQDISINQNQELFCFTCFNLYSKDTLNEEIPKFPKNLERRKLRKKLLTNSDSKTNSPFLKKII